MLADYLSANRMVFKSMAEDGELDLADKVRDYNNRVCEQTDMPHHIIDPTAAEVHKAYRERLDAAEARRHG
jgi:hypothetical protein